MVDYVKECREQADNTFYDPLKESWTMVGDHIEGLQRLQEETRKALTSQIETNAQLADRVVKLEQALAHIYAWYPISVSEPIQTIHEIRDYARKALKGGPGEAPAS